MKRSVKVILIMLAALLALGAAGSLFLRHWLGRTRYVRDEDVALDRGAYESEAITERMTEAAVHPADVYDISRVRPLTEAEAADTYTLLVIGGEEAAGDASAVIVMTINHRTREVVCDSFDTDLYVEIPETGGGRLGNAYAVGGGPLLAETMEKNYGIRIDNYAAISFRDVARILHMPAFETMDVSKEGLAVVKELVYSLGAMKATEVTGYIAELLPYVTHNLDSARMLRVLLQVPRIIPYYGLDGMIPGELPVRELDGFLVPDAQALSAFLQEQLYAAIS